MLCLTTNSPDGRHWIIHLSLWPVSAEHSSGANKRVSSTLGSRVHGTTMCAEDRCIDQEGTGSVRFVSVLDFSNKYSVRFGSVRKIRFDAVRPALFGRVVARSGSVRFCVRFRPVPKLNGSVRFGSAGSVRLVRFGFLFLPDRCREPGHTSISSQLIQPLATSELVFAVVVVLHKPHVYMRYDTCMITFLSIHMYTCMHVCMYACTHV